MKRVTLALVTACFVVFSASAGVNRAVDEKTWETAKKNYIALLSHENPGVKSSAANIIRQYEIVEATQALEAVLECENCEMVKISAALALLDLNEEKGKQVIRKALYNEENELVRAFYRFVLQEHDPMSYPVPFSENGF